MTDGGVSARQFGGVMSMPELVRLVLSGNSSEWRDGATRADRLSQDHAVISDRGRQALTRLESAWTGGGADAARVRILPAVEATYQASSAYQSNARTLTDMSYAFDRLKSELEPMPDQPPSRGFWDYVTPWDTDTEDEITRYKELEERNRRAYEAYEQYTRLASQQVTYDYGQLDEFGDGEITLARDEVTGRARSIEAEPRSLDRKQVADDSRRGDGDESRREADDPAGDARDRQDRKAGTDSEPGDLRPAVHYQEPQDSSFVRTHPGGDGFTGDRVGSDSTSVSGYQPPSDPSSTYRPAAYQPSTVNPSGSPVPGGGTQSPWSTAGGSPLVGGYGGASASGTAGLGTGGGRPGTGTGGASSSPPGVGRGSGAVPLGPTANPVQGAARPGVAGMAGRAGMAPMGAMGGAAGRGPGSEDSEHQRNYVQDTDEAFSLGDEEDLRDPQTGHIITPPTIGG